MRHHTARAAASGALTLLALAACGPSEEREDVSAPAQAVFAHAGATRSYDCGGHGLDVVGSGNRLRLTGTCTVLNVTGPHNAVTVAHVDVITILGPDSHVSYEGAPRVNVTGAGSAAAASAPAGTPGPDRSPARGNAYVTGVRLHRTVTCHNGGDLHLSGSRTTLRVHGCATVYITGDTNEVHADDATTAVATSGDDNTVHAAGHPRTTDVGRGNRTEAETANGGAGGAGRPGGGGGAGAVSPM